MELEYGITFRKAKTYEIKYNPETFGRKINKILRQNGITAEQYIELLKSWETYGITESRPASVLYYPDPLELYRIKILENTSLHIITPEGFFHGRIISAAFITEVTEDGMKQGVKFGLYIPFITEDTTERTTSHNKPRLKYDPSNYDPEF